jgi:methyl-accepting chemotaxis protein
MGLSTADVSQTFALFDKTMIGLVKGDADLGLPRTQDQAVLRQLAVAREQWEKIRPAVEKLVPMAPNVNKALKQVLDNNLKVLKAMNDAVSLFEDEAEARLNALRRTQYGIVIASLVLAGIAFVLARLLIVSPLKAMMRVTESTSTELKALADQQASGARNQASAMTEISTTLKELLAISQQIVQSAQGVARIADDTGNAATSGNSTLDKAKGGIDGMKGHVDAIVTHMLDHRRHSRAHQRARRADQHPRHQCHHRGVGRG